VLHRDTELTEDIMFNSFIILHYTYVQLVQFLSSDLGHVGSSHSKQVVFLCCCSCSLHGTQDNDAIDNAKMINDQINVMLCQMKTT
jgi:hypothetical protein